MLGPSPFESQRPTLEHLRRLVAQSSPARGLLVGPSGGGKSWMLEQLYGELHQSGRVVWLASGSAQGRTRSFEPFNSAISRRSSQLGNRRIAVQGLAALGRAVPAAGSLAAFVTEWLANEEHRRRREATMHLRPDEFEVLSHMVHAAGDRECVLLADNLQHWDSDSLNLLLDLLGGRLQPAFEFIGRLQIIATLCEGALHIQAPEILSQVTEISTWSRITLPAITRTEINTAFALFGLAAPLSASDAETVFALTGGHLALIKHLALYLCTASGTESRIATLTHDQLARIFTDRLESLGAQGSDTRMLLEIAAVIGEVSTIEEIVCASNRPRTVVTRLVADSLDLKLVSRVEGGIRFTHEIVRECILATLGNAVELHSALAACLTRLRPWDFRTRAEHFLRGDQRAVAARLLFAEIYRRRREGIPFTDAEQNEMMLLLSESGANQVGTSLVRAAEALRDGRWEDVERILESVPDTAHAHFVGEKLLLLATLRMQSSVTSDRHEAVRLLRAAQRLELEEPDIKIRVQLTLLAALVHTGSRDDARDLHLEISQRLGRLGQFDPHAAWMLQILNRKSGMMCGAERAAHLCKIAADFFGPQGENEAPRSPSQYYMALTNLAGNWICCGRFRDAATAAVEGLQIWDRYSRHSIPKRDKCVANLALAAFLVGDIPASRALETMDAGIVTENKSWFLRSNHAVFRALSGDIVGALQELTEAVAELERRHHLDPHHRYIIRTNFASLLHLAGKTDEGVALWEKLAQELAPVEAQDRPFYLARQELQRTAFSTIAHGDAQGWFDYLQREHPRHLGYGWAFWGRGFLLSDVQLWSET